MNGQKSKERNVTSKETTREERSKNIGANAVQAAQRASKQIDEIDTVIAENDAANAEIARLMDEIDKIFGQEDAEALVNQYVQKGGQ